LILLNPAPYRINTTPHFDESLQPARIPDAHPEPGNEHEQTYQYLDYLERATGVPIIRVKADFSSQITGKRKLVKTKWREQGIEELVVLAALDVLQALHSLFSLDGH
jgi:hypothetical protein